MRRLAVLAAALVAMSAAPAAAPAEPYRHQPNPTATGSGGAVATVDSVATDAAIRTLEAGGNAVDAAVVAAAVLGVTDPFSCGIGGGGFLVASAPGDGRVTTLDHREQAPAAMRPDSFFDERTGTARPFTEARFSGMSVGVPGTVAGWAEALERHGTLTLAEALAPAIDVAREGFVIDDTFHAQIAQNADVFDDVPSSARLFLDEDGEPRPAGTVFRNPDLARAYERIAMLGPKGFYRGAIADAMVDAVRHPPIATDADHPWRPGVMTMRDVRGYDAIERAPTHVGFRGLDVFGMGPPSSGGSTVGEALNVLEGFDLAALGRAEATHLVLEASRFAFADRNAYIGDPAFFDVPLRGLLSDGFAAERRALIDRARAAASPVAPGDPHPHDGGGGSGGQASTTVMRTGSTTHITTVDDAGGVASYTFTIESVGGNGIVVPGWGFLLNNELTDFNYDSLTHPNRVEGGKRPRSSMSPTIVQRDGRPVLALGSPGGSTIITTVLQLLVDRFDRGRDLPEALAAPRASQRNTRSTLVEPGFPDRAALASFGHTFGLSPEIGAATAIELLPDGRALAVAEPERRGGGAAGAIGP